MVEEKIKKAWHKRLLGIVLSIFAAIGIAELIKLLRKREDGEEKRKVTRSSIIQIMILITLLLYLGFVYLKFHEYI